MKKNWVISFYIGTASIAYAGCVFLFKLHPLNAFILLTEGKNFHLTALASPFIYITLLYYAIILPKTKTGKIKSIKTNKNSKSANNVCISDNNKKDLTHKASVLGKAKLNIESYAVPVIYKETEAVTPNHSQLEEQQTKLIQNLNLANPIEKRTQELENELTKYVTPAPANKETEPFIKQPKILTLLREEKSMEPGLMSMMNDISSGYSKEEAEDYGHEIPNDVFAIAREQFEAKEQLELETLVIDKQETISDIDAKHVAEGIADGNSLYEASAKQSRRKATFNMLDSLNDVLNLESNASNTQLQE